MIYNKVEKLDIEISAIGLAKFRERERGSRSAGRTINDLPNSNSWIRRSSYDDNTVTSATPSRPAGVPD